MEAFKMAQAEMNSIITERRVLEPLTKNLLPVADRNYKFGKEVLVYSNVEKEWAGPFEVTHVQGRMIKVQIKETSVLKTFSSFQVKPFYKDSQQNIHFFKSFYDVMDSMTSLTEVIQSYDPKSQLLKINAERN